MTCDDAQVLLSAAFDGETDADEGALVAALAHRETCASCRRFAEHLSRARAHLRAMPPGAAEGRDLAAAVLAQARREDAAAAGAAIPTAPAPDRGAGPRPRRRPLSAAAVFVAAAVGAALLVHTSADGPDVAAASLAERVLAAQHEVSSLSATLHIVERGWNPAAPERRFEGTLGYEAPETLALSLRDRTGYPDASWVPNDVDLSVQDDTWVVLGLRDCPSRAQPGCTPEAPDRRSVTGRPPFADAAPAPLDLVMPVQSFALAGTAATLSDLSVGGRPTVGIETTAAQVGPLLDGLRPTGNLRRVHPADPVELRLDRETLVPLQVTVLAGDGPDRRAWADVRGYGDRPGAEVLELTLTDVVVNGPVPGLASPASAAGTATVDGGFADRPVGDGDAPRPQHLPPGLRPHRSGVTDTPQGPKVSTRTWTDGRAWLSVSATDEWPGRRLFGDLGATVRPLDLGAGGTGYLSEDGERIGLHTTDRDLLVSGSVSRPDLVAAAASLGVVGELVPDDWDEAATASVAEARAAVQPLLLPGPLDGFDPPALRVEDAAVVASFAGAGDRSFTLEQSAMPKLPPPTDTDGVVPISVRGLPGRYAAARGALEWYEGANFLRLRSLALSRAELLAIAGQLREP